MSSATTPSLPEAAQRYLAAGLCVLPARDKHPSLWAWKEFRARLPTQTEVQKWFAKPQDALCVVCGQVSGNLEILDFDFGAELFDPWLERVIEQSPDLPDRLVVESSPSGGRHVAYRCSAPVEGNLKLAARRVECPDADPVVIAGKTCKPRQSADGRFFAELTLIETRGEGGLFLCAPSPGYEMLSGDLTRLGVLSADEREILLESARSLTEHLPEPANTPLPPVDGTRPGNGFDAHGSRPGDDFNLRGDIRPVLQRHGWTPLRSGENEHWCRPGKTRGTSATLKDGVFYVFSSNAAPFEPATAYSKFAVHTLLEHGNDWSAAAAALRSQGFGGEPPKNDVDISALLPAEPKSEPSAPASDDPGPLPDDLLRVPGFVSEVMDHCLETAPYPNPVMAFGGALSLQAFLAGRKVRDPGDNRTNLYLLGLAHSASGKDWPRKLNTRILHAIGLADCLGDRFASGEGLQDALFLNPAMLFQTDEIDGMLQSINKSKDARHESIMGTMLTLYSASNSVFPMRRLAGQQQSRGAIDQPHLVVFGTAIPNHYYDSLSERMLTNGYFARNFVLESGPRSKGRDPRIAEVPQRILDVARWWADFRPGTGNLEHWHPVPAIVECDTGAQVLLADARELVDREYERCERNNDPVGTTVWGRAGEHIRKLALIHAISANPRSPVINRAAVDWAIRFVLHHVRRSLHMVIGHVADTPFDADCLKLLRKLREAPGRALEHSVLLKRMKMDAKSFHELIGTLQMRGDVVPDDLPGSGRTGRVYRLRE